MVFGEGLKSLSGDPSAVNQYTVSSFHRVILKTFSQRRDSCTSGLGLSCVNNSVTTKEGPFMVPFLLLITILFCVFICCAVNVEMNVLDFRAKLFHKIFLNCYNRNRDWLS